MDFLKLVQKKEHKTDNKIIIVMIFFVVLIMSAVVFWPSSSKYNLLAYLPDNTSFYYHFTNKDTFSDKFFEEDTTNDIILELKNILGNNFLNLQEILWFQVDTNQDNSYLLRFSRLPKSFLNDLENDNSKFIVSSPQKNILLLTLGQEVTLAETNIEKDIYFEDGISIYWKKNNSPEFLNSLANILEPVFVDNEILLNWQRLSNGKTKLSLLENRPSDVKDIRYFLMPKEFDLVFGFNSDLTDILSENVINNLLKPFFDSLPYYNLDSRVIKSRLFSDAILWQIDDGWILASEHSWQDDILDFIDTFDLEEVDRVLSDGTAYIELVATSGQSIIEHQINGQKVSQVDDLFIWDIGDQHYLSNQKGLIEKLSSYNHYLVNILGGCSEGLDAKIGDVAYFETKDIPEGKIKDYLLDKQINSLEISSYTTGTVSGLNICF